MASARDRSSIVNGVCMGPRSRCNTPSAFRGVRSNAQIIEDMFCRSVLRSASTGPSLPTSWHRIDSPRE